MATAPTDKITGGIIIIGGIGLMGLLAGINSGVGNIMVVIMVGFLVLWLISGSGNTLLSGWVGKINPGSKTVLA